MTPIFWWMVCLKDWLVGGGWVGWCTVVGGLLSCLRLFALSMVGITMKLYVAQERNDQPRDLATRAPPSLLGVPH